MGNSRRNYKKSPEIQDMIKIRKENMAKYFFDLSKLTFAALVLGLGGALLNVDKWDILLTIAYIPTIIWYIFLVGSIGTIWFACIGYLILKAR